MSDAPPKRMRLDERLVADGLAESRTRAQRVIIAGQVRVDGQLSDKASKQVEARHVVEVVEQPRFVSRGGDKLANGIDDMADRIAACGLVLDGATAIDVGASTGGFTDCLLQRGVARVVAVDVGWGQLHHRLRTDDRVHVMERTNARHLTPQDLPFVPDLIVCDVSFISLGTVLPAPIACMAPGFWGLLLCKPQFEAGRDRMRASGGKGVIRDDELRATILDETIEAVGKLGMRVESHVEARPPGPKGNREFVLLVTDAR